MRLFQNLREAESEIRRDLAKGTLLTSTRVQQRTGLNLKGRERVAYEYGIQHFPDYSANDLVEFGQNAGFPLYMKDPIGMRDWLQSELESRISANSFLQNKTQVNEMRNPALQTTMEGNHPSYTYAERMIGMMDTLHNDLARNRDTRRAFWPIFQPVDAIRSAESTRVPCSLGYQPLIRKVGDVDTMLFFYLERSCDFDNFWLSDVWFAHKIQATLARWSKAEVGVLHHFIISFHSFQVEDQEIY